VTPLARHYNAAILRRITDRPAPGTPLSSPQGSGQRYKVGKQRLRSTSVHLARVCPRQCRDDGNHRARGGHGARGVSNPAIVVACVKSRPVEHRRHDIYDTALVVLRVPLWDWLRQWGVRFQHYATVGSSLQCRCVGNSVSGSRARQASEWTGVAHLNHCRCRGGGGAGTWGAEPPPAGLAGFVSEESDAGPRPLPRGTPLPAVQPGCRRWREFL